MVMKFPAKKTVMFRDMIMSLSWRVLPLLVVVVVEELVKMELVEVEVGVLIAVRSMVITTEQMKVEAIRPAWVAVEQ